MARVVRFHQTGEPEVLKVESIPIPTPLAGQVLIRVKAFGINRSEMFTRQGHSPGVRFPRVLGIEAVGLVEKVPGDEFRKGDIVATAMVGMGRAFGGQNPKSGFKSPHEQRNPPKDHALKYFLRASQTLPEHNLS